MNRIVEMVVLMSAALSFVCIGCGVDTEEDVFGDGENSRSNDAGSKEVDSSGGRSSADQSDGSQDKGQAGNGGPQEADGGDVQAEAGVSGTEETGGSPSKAGSGGSISNTGGTGGIVPVAGSGGTIAPIGGSGGNTGGTGGGVSNPFAMYIMLDQSGSMWIPDIDLQYKNIVASNAIRAFVDDPNSAGVSVALGYFPIVDATCDGGPYEVPAVPMGHLPDNAAAISDALATMFSFGDSTPTEPALIGATNYCAKYERDPVANPNGEDCVVILITDGLPEECNTGLAYLASIVAGAYTDYGIATNVIGLPATDFAWVEEMNRQGGSVCTVMNPAEPETNPCQMGSSMTPLEALEMIRDYH